jgi:hypothetical protein
MLDLFLAPESWPFAVAVALLLAIAIIEGAGLMLGMSVSGWLDQLLPDDPVPAEGLAEAWLGWLHLGRVPTLVLLTLLLTGFAVIGLAFNGLLHGLFGFYPSPLIGAPLAFFGALPVVRLGAAGIARIMPKDETSAVPLASLVGHIAIVVNGTARIGYPAQAKTRSEGGQTFYVHVEPDRDDVEFKTGDAVLLVNQISGARFHAILNPRPDLL